MLFWQRRQVYLGDLAGFNRARRILRENGIPTEEKTMLYPGGIPEETRRRMNALGQTCDRDALYALYVHFRAAETARRLLGSGE